MTFTSNIIEVYISAIDGTYHLYPLYGECLNLKAIKLFANKIYSFFYLDK